MAYTVAELNAASHAEAAAMLDGLYIGALWIAEQTVAARPFRSLAHLKHVMVQVVSQAGTERQVALIRAQTEVSDTVMAQQRNADYRRKFGFPFVLATQGPRGTGLSIEEIINTFERRIQNPVDVEHQEALRQIHRKVELGLNEQFGMQPVLGNDVWDWHEQLSVHSDPGYAEKGQLTVTYLTDAHRACAQDIFRGMHECGFDEVNIDAVGNVVGRYNAATPDALTLLTGSHYDTVRNAGKYDGRLGIFVPMACVRALHRQRRRLPFHIEVIGFAEEEGQRYKATFLGSGALIGDFMPAWLEQKDAAGISMRDAMAHAGLCIDDIPKLKRDPTHYLGFIEVHIEQGPVLNELDLPLGIVTSINGSVRYVADVHGMASHAGTTPMNRRRDAALAVAELALYVEKRAAQDGDSVGTIGMLEVPGGSINVVPGLCRFSLDLRAPTNPQRDALVHDVLAEFDAICTRRGVRQTLEETMRVPAAPSHPVWQERWERAVDAIGVPLHRMPSGAGHDAMKLHEVMPQAMLFVRGENSGISHNPLESSTSDDMQLAIEALLHLLEQIATPT